jgi:hypothetical protein
MSILNLNGPTGYPSRTKRSAKIWMGIGLVIAVLGVGSTLASTITINKGVNTEFGQGVQRTVYCGGNQTINLIPISGFINSQDSTPIASPEESTPSASPTDAPGSFYLAGIRVTNIPKACSGKDFVFSAYDNSGSIQPVAISTRTSDGLTMSTPTVYWLHGSEYGGILSLSRTDYIDPAGLASLSNIEQDGDFGGFIISIADGAGLTHAPIDSISRIVVETQDDTFGAEEHTNNNSPHALSTLS